MKNINYRKYLIIGVLLLFVGAITLPSVMSVETQETQAVTTTRPTWCVDDYGTDLPGWGLSFAQPFATIQYAINVAAPTGDTILVGDGTYNENLIVDKQLTLIGHQNGPGPSIIHGAGGVLPVHDHVVYVIVDWVNISGFTIQNSGTSDWTCSGVCLRNAATPIVDHCLVTGNIITSNLAGINMDNADDNEISYNTIENNENGMILYPGNSNTISFNTFNMNVESGIYSTDASSFNVISDNVFSSNNMAIMICGDQNTIQNNIIGSLNDYGIFLANDTFNNIIIWNNVTRNNIGIYTDTASIDNIIENNTIQCNKYGIYDWCSDGNTISYNFIRHNDHGLYTIGSDNLIYNNYFANTICNAHDVSGANEWDIDPPIPGTNIMGGDYIGGNYWDDYPYWHKYGLWYRPNGNGIVTISGDGYPIPGGGAVDDHPIPGFELVAVIAAFAIALLLFRRKKIV